MQKDAPDPVMEIVVGCTPNARTQLGILLGELVRTLDNLEILCPVSSPPCHDHLQFKNLRRLYSVLRVQPANESHTADA
jgi:hypothetical protein